MICVGDMLRNAVPCPYFKGVGERSSPLTPPFTEGGKGVGERSSPMTPPFTEGVKGGVYAPLEP